MATTGMMKLITSASDQAVRPLRVMATIAAPSIGITT